MLLLLFCWSALLACARGQFQPNPDVFVPVNQRNCQVRDIKGQPMFDVGRITGNWYVLKRTSMASLDPLAFAILDALGSSEWFRSSSDSMKLKFEKREDPQQGKTIMGSSGSLTRHFRFFGIPINLCRPIPYTAMVARDPSDPATFYFDGSYEIPGFDITKIVEGILGETYLKFTILSTDYQNYAVVYNCKDIRDNGECADPMVLVLSRAKTLMPFQEQLVRAKLDTVCIQYQNLFDEAQIDASCRPPGDGMNYRVARRP